MPTSGGIIPFAELFERVKNEELRDKTTDTQSEDKYKGSINETYRIWLPSEFEFNAYKKNASITTAADYTTGTVAITKGSTAIVGTSTVWTTAHSTLKIYIKSGHEIYTFTRTAATTGTIDRAYVDATTTSSSYVIFKRRYSLASDFWRPVTVEPEHGAFYYYKNGTRVDLIPKWSEEWGQQDYSNPGIPAYYHIVCESGVYYVEISPPDTDARTIFYDYIPYLTPMVEYTTGTAAVTNGDATVTVTGGDFVSNVSAGDWFRIDADGTGSSSVWYEVSSVTDTTVALGVYTTHLELTSTYAGATVSGKAYTISEEPALPPIFHPLIICKTALDRAADRDAKQLQFLVAMTQRALEKAKALDEGYNTDTRVPSIYGKGRR